MLVDFGHLANSSVIYGHRCYRVDVCRGRITPLGISLLEYDSVASPVHCPVPPQSMRDETTVVQVSQVTREMFRSYRNNIYWHHYATKL